MSRSFITNKDGDTLLKRFNDVLEVTKTFECIVGYFYASGFSLIADSLKNTEKIKILIGLSTDEETYQCIQKAKYNTASDPTIKKKYAEMVKGEMDNSDDSEIVEKGVNQFIEWIRSGKLEVKAYPSANIHAKVYIMSFDDERRKGVGIDGHIITGSSNLSRSGLEKNLEFNVELRDPDDYAAVKLQFDELWEDAIDVTDEFVTTIEKKTWLSNSITPYQLYLKFLYEYLKEQIDLDKIEVEYDLPEGYKDYQYQKDAVIEARIKLEQYGGVFISDVVGLGKTYTTAMLLKSLDARAIVVAPPALLDSNNPGSWQNVLRDFNVRTPLPVSSGNIQSIKNTPNLDRYNYVVIDESHKFRNEDTQMYEELYDICRNRKVILISATPLNNSPKDILSQLLLFENRKHSNLPNPETRDLEQYFNKLEIPLRHLDRQKDKEKYLEIVKQNSEKIRKDILKELMIRRTRTSIERYYEKDMKEQKLRFPEVNDPKALYYKFDEKTDGVFMSSLEDISRKFKYARYTPLLYLINSETQRASGQRNMMGFMRMMLAKRLESSFYAFKCSIKRMIQSYESFIKMYESGTVYTGDSSVHNMMRLVEEGNFEKINKLIDDDRAASFPSTAFRDDFLDDLLSDLELLRTLDERWKPITYDPKLSLLTEKLNTDPHLKNKKVLIFTESKETADYLKEKLSESFGNCVLAINGSSDPDVRGAVIKNFDGKLALDKQEDEYRILISTEVLSEGVNLHRSNVVINYDIPWNPVHMIQRVGRINRLDTAFSEIYTYNFFPTQEINDELKLEEAAIAKIEAFIEMLGADAKLLTDEDIKSHDLFDRLSSKKTLQDNEEDVDPELKYLREIRTIRDTKPDLFTEISNLPKKARVARKSDSEGLVTFFRNGKIRKIYYASSNGVDEIEFDKAAELLHADENENRMYRVPLEMYKYLEKNKEEFDNYLNYDDSIKPRNNNSSSKVRSMVNTLVTSYQDKFTPEELDYLRSVLDALDLGTILPTVTKAINHELEKVSSNDKRPIEHIILDSLKKHITKDKLERSKKIIEIPVDTKEIVLSEYYGS